MSFFSVAPVEPTDDLGLGSGVQSAVVKQAVSGQTR